MDVMAIMEEYGGILRLPQTPESAIVHMVDALVTKIELLDQDTMSSTWNQDMVIYQTLNELSQNGRYQYQSVFAYSRKISPGGFVVMTLLLEEEVEIPFTFDYRKVAEDVISQALEVENFPYDVEVSLVLTNDEEIHTLNQQFREIDRSTDVLSFPMMDYPAPGDFSLLDLSAVSENEELILGDIVISVEHVMAQAKEYGHSFKREYAFLIAHSMLHLMGYDHMSPEEASIMEERQSYILDLLHITREEEKNV